MVINVDSAMSLSDSADLSEHLNHHLTHELPNLGTVSVQVLPVE